MLEVDYVFEYSGSIVLLFDVVFVLVVECFVYLVWWFVMEGEFDGVLNFDMMCVMMDGFVGIELVDDDIV